MKSILTALLIALLGLVAGLALGLLVSWVLFPTEYVDTSPITLRADYKDQFRAAIASAYSATGNLQRAAARLAYLDNANAEMALVEQAGRLQSSGQSPETAFEIALLVKAIHEQAPFETMSVPTVPPTRTVTPAQTATSTISFVSTPLITSTPGPSATPMPSMTPPPTRTPTPTPGLPFKVLYVKPQCDPTQAGVLIIEVSNAASKPISGAEVIVTWENGSEHIFTGLKPELGNGYADFQMQADVIYSAQMADGGETASNLAIHTCQGEDGYEYEGNIQVIFQQP